MPQDREKDQNQVHAAHAAHAARAAEADASVARARDLAQSDPLRPLYHVMPPAYWMNDPNGPIWFNDAYHLFYQHNPFAEYWGNMSWGHAVSRDLAHWEHAPIALVPDPGAYDSDGVFSGCCVDDNGTPTIIYTGVFPEVQCLATSDDDLRTWRKHPANPVIAARPREDLEGFRDPFVWKEADGWYMAIGSGIDGVGGAVLLYHSLDLVQWTYLHPLCTGFGTNWECPLFFPLGDRYVLIVSPHGDVRYSIGDYRDHRFSPGAWRRLDAAVGGPFYAPHCLEDPRGRRILWGWLRVAGSEGAPWNGCMSLPRVLSLLPDGSLGIAPAEELESLRSAHQRFESLELGAGAVHVLDRVSGDALEIRAEIMPGNAEQVGIDVLRSEDGNERCRIEYDHVAQRITVGAHSGDFQLPAGEDTLYLHVFVDRSVIEVYANGRAALATGFQPCQAGPRGVALFCAGRKARFKAVDVWRVNSIWQ